MTPLDRLCERDLQHVVGRVVIAEDADEQTSQFFGMLDEQRRHDGRIEPVGGGVVIVQGGAKRAGRDDGGASMIARRPRMKHFVGVQVSRSSGTSGRAALMPSAAMPETMNPIMAAITVPR